jgi:hypothetical protein
VGLHRRGDASGAVQLVEARERGRHPLQRHRERDHAAAVDRRGDHLRGQARRRRDLGEKQTLERMLGPAVPARLPAAGATESQHPGVLARAVVIEPLGRATLLEATLQLLLGGRRLREEGANGGDLIFVGEVRSGSDREVAVVQVLARPGERQCLERLRRRAEETDQRRVACDSDDVGAVDGDGMHMVPRLDYAATADDYAERIRHGDGRVSA